MTLLIPAILAAFVEIIGEAPPGRVGVDLVGVAAGTWACSSIARSEGPLLRQSRVLVALGVLSSAVVAGSVWPGPIPWAIASVWVAIVTAGVAASRIRNGGDVAVVAWLVLLVFGSGYRFVLRGHEDEGVVSIVMLLTLVSVSTGLLLRAQRQSQEAQRAVVLAEARTEMARDLHDVIAHEVIGIVVLATAARAHAHGDSRKALERIENSGRRALADIRAMVGTLRTGEAQHGTSDPGDLVERFRDMVAADVVAELDPAVRAPEVAETVVLVAHRVLAESLNNIRRHATDATRVDIRLRLISPETVSLQIADNGSGAAGSVGGGGQGLPGLQERVAEVGGTLSARRAATGWAVDVTMPARGRAYTA
ncbi:sensor histidine kinase [Nocardia sp. NPDC057668]|uniref:sensor histidine kinase n=1 Tax=Nocardia sp. NPDC057668 TaxID=3346202 RepID=UPI00366EFD37